MTLCTKVLMYVLLVKPAFSTRRMIIKMNEYKKIATIGSKNYANYRI